MSSGLAVRLGTEMPQIRHTPPDVASLAAGEEAVELANAYGVCDGYPLSPSQEWRLLNAMGERADGRWAAPTVADFGGRQGAGKTDVINARELYGLFVAGERLLIHTAHEFPTANESFLRFVGVLEAWDDLRKKVARIRYANGEQGVELLSGARLKYRARTGGSGRGFAKADLVVYDEAQHLIGEHVAASGPARLANPNSQSWYAGSGGFAHSIQAWKMRLRALSGAGGRLAYSEHTAEQPRIVDGELVVDAVDPDDIDNWYRANPGLGRWVEEEAMAALKEELGDLFPRECLCVWEPMPGAGHQGPIDLDAWRAQAQISAIASNRKWALAVSSDRKWAALGVAGRRDDGKYHVEWMEHRSGTSWVVGRCAEAYETTKIPLRVHDAGAEGSLIGELEEAGVEVETVSTGDFARCSGAVIDHVNARTLVHLGQPSLDKAVERVGTKQTTQGATVFVEKNPGDDITTLKAVTVAFGGVAELEPEFYVY